MATLTPYFSANRTVREYTEKYYLPGAKAYRGALPRITARSGRRIVQWRRTIELGWAHLHFGAVTVREEKDSGAAYNRFEVQLSLGDISPDMLLVELFALGINGAPAIRQKLDLQSLASAGSGDDDLRGQGARPTGPQPIIPRGHCRFCRAQWYRWRRRGFCGRDEGRFW